MKFKLAIWFLWFWTNALFGQNQFSNKNPFDNLYFIENKGQFDQKYNSNRPLLSPASVLWTGETNVYLQKNGSGFVWETTLLSQEEELQATSISNTGTEEDDKSFELIKVFKEEEEKEEEEHRAKPVSKQIQFQLLGTNPNAVMVAEESSKHYWTCGPQKWNSRGYKKITFKNIYPHIDIVYQVGNEHSQKGLIKYSFILHPGAKVRDIQFQFTSTESKHPLKVSQENKKLIIQNDWLMIEEFGITVSDSSNSSYSIQYQSDKTQSRWGYSLFKGDQKVFTVKKTTEIDPFVRLIDTLKEAKTIYYRWADLSNMVVSVDYDNNQNAYVLSACLLYPQVAKFNSQGQLQWIFSGQLPAINWYSSFYNGPLTASIICEKSTGNILIADGWNYQYGSKLIQLKNNGTFDSIVAESNQVNLEIWDLSKSCNSIIAAGGGLIDFGLNMWNIKPNNSSFPDSYFPLTSDSVHHYQDVVRSIINQDNYLYSILNHSLPVKYWDSTQQRYITREYKHLTKFIKSSSDLEYRIQEIIISPWLDFYELINYPNIYDRYSNHNNCLAVNSQVAFVYDGKVFMAIDIDNSNILAIDSVPYHNGVRGHIGQSGIAVDDCNRVFLGGDSAQVLVYQFTGSKFIYDTTFKLIQATPRATIDVRLDRNSGSVFVTGDSFVASFNSPYNCNLTLFKIDTFLINSCQGDYAAVANLFDSADSPKSGVGPWQSGYQNLLDSNSQITFLWSVRNHQKDSVVRQMNLKIGQIDTLKNPRLSDTIELTISFQYDCNGPYQKYLFVPRFKDTTRLLLNLCQGDTFFLNVFSDTSGSGSGSGSGSDSVRRLYFSSDTAFSVHLTNQDGCDSLIQYKITFSPVKRDTLYLVGCSQDTFYIPNKSNPHRIIYTNGWFSDTFNQSNGCDSIWVNRADFGKDTSYAILYPFCWGDTAVFSGKSYTQNAIHVDSLKAQWGCDSIVRRKIQFYPKLDTFISLTLCPNEVFTYKNQSYSAPFTILDTVTSFNGCDSSISIQLNLSPIKGYFDLDSTDNPYFSFVQKSTGNIGFVWSFGDGISDSIHYNTAHQYNNQQDRKIQVCLQVWDSINCRDTVCQWINIYKLAFWIYNVFTPDDDGINDLHRIGYRNESLLHDVYIYNRWGALVYLTEKSKISDPHSYWNGRVMNNGEFCPAGSYFVIYRFYTNGPNSSPITIEGNVTLIR